MKHSTLTRRTLRLLLGFAALCALGWGCAAPAQAASARSWPSYRRSRAGERTEVDETVRVLQYLLRACGYSVVTDGVFGKSTDTAVRRFQRAHHLIADGRTAPPTWEALIVRVVPGSKGPAVSAAQVLLRDAGYDVPVDGVIGLYTWNELFLPGGNEAGD